MASRAIYGNINSIETRLVVFNRLITILVIKNLGRSVSEAIAMP
jgi:hypothetical protein